jgi:hypothetical protein
MGSANDTAVDASTSETSPTSTASGTEELASRLEEAGYETTFQPGGAAPSAIRSGSVAFIELHVTQKEAPEIEDLIEEIDPTVPHRTIGPNDTEALPDWPNISETDNNESKRPLYIIPSHYSSPSPEQKAQHRASSL